MNCSEVHDVEKKDWHLFAASFVPKREGVSSLDTPSWLLSVIGYCRDLYTLSVQS